MRRQFHHHGSEAHQMARCSMEIAGSSSEQRAHVSPRLWAAVRTARDAAARAAWGAGPSAELVEWMNCKNADPREALPRSKFVGWTPSWNPCKNPLVVSRVTQQFYLTQPHLCRLNGHEQRRRPRTTPSPHLGSACCHRALILRLRHLIGPTSRDRHTCRA